jgi:hypothetical protein
MDEWEKFFSSMQEKINKSTFKDQLGFFFGEESKYMKIWKNAFSLFIVVVVYIYFLKALYLDYENKNENFLKIPNSHTDDLTIIKVYKLINLMYIIDMILNLIHFFTLNSLLDKLLNIFLIIPIKILMCIPISIDSKYLLVIKFIRLDSISNLVTLSKDYCRRIIEVYVHKDWLKVTMIYLNEILKYLFMCILYAHFMTCIYAAIEKDDPDLNSDPNESFYIKCLYITFSTFTNVGYGEYTPHTNTTFFLFMINMYFGYSLFILITYHVRMLFSQYQNFKKKQSNKKEFEDYLFKLQKSTGKIVPRDLRNIIYAHLLLKKAMSFPEFFEIYKKYFKYLRNDFRNKITESLFDYMSKEFNIFFYGCSRTFMMKVFTKLKPKIFKPGKILINKNEKVEKLYFIVKGEIEILHNQYVEENEKFEKNQNQIPFFEIKNSTIIGDWYFHTGTLSEYVYKVCNDHVAIGFELNSKDFIKIAEDEIESAREFVLKSYIKMGVYKEVDNLYYESFIDNNRVSFLSKSNEESKLDHSRINNFNQSSNEINFKGEINQSKITKTYQNHSMNSNLRNHYSTFTQFQFNPTFIDVENRFKEEDLIEEKISYYKNCLIEKENEFYKMKNNISERSEIIREKVLKLSDSMIKLKQT